MKELKLRVAAAITAVIFTACSGNNEPSSAATKNWRVLHSQGNFHFIHIDESHWQDTEQYRQAVREICDPKGFCSLDFWKDPKMVPSKFPLNRDQIAAKIPVGANYMSDGKIRVRWMCDVLRAPERCPSGVEIDTFER